LSYGPAVRASGAAKHVPLVGLQTNHRATPRVRAVSDRCKLQLARRTA